MTSYFFKHKLSFLIIALCLFIGGLVIVMETNRSYTIKKNPKNPGKFEAWNCAFERDHLPPLKPEADKIFKEARRMEKELKNPTDAQKTQIFLLYKKAAEMNHWKAMYNLADCYLTKWGTPYSSTSADEVYEKMMDLGIPAGYYGKARLAKEGRAVPQDDEKDDALMHQAADLGNPWAQHRLGEFYIYKEDRDRQGLAYHVCALRQGYAKSAYQIGRYLYMMEKNYPMAMAYYWRGAALGDYNSASTINSAFMEESQQFGTKVTYGYAPDQELFESFSNYSEQISDGNLKSIPDLFKKHPMPVNPLISEEKSRQMPSKLKEAFQNQWPDKLFLELEPDYLPPEY